MMDTWNKLKKELHQKSMKHKGFGFDWSAFGWCYMSILEQLPLKAVQAINDHYKKQSKWRRFWHGDQVFSEAMDIATDTAKEEK